MIRSSPALLVPLLLPALSDRPAAAETRTGAKPPLAAEMPMTPIFRDRAAAAGVDFTHTNGMSGALYIVENLGAGGALFDYDNDGDLDIYLVQGHPLRPADPERHPPPPTGAIAHPGDRLYRNDTDVSAQVPTEGLTGGATERTGGWRFTDVTDAAEIRAFGYGMGVATGDYDNDGWIDLYVTNWGANQLLHNDGDGTFSDRTRESGTDDLRWSVPATFFDFDRDGWLDLYVGNYVDFIYARHRVCATESGDRDYCDPLSYEAEPDRLFRNNGDGTFSDVTHRAGLDTAYGPALGAVAADFDGDRFLDLYVANDLATNQLWINDGHGAFTDLALLAGCAVNRDGQVEASMGVVAGDLDGDGDDDLFMTHLTRETNTLFVNDGRGRFDDRTLTSGLGTPSWRYTSFGTGLVDYDNDGRLDLVVVSGAVHRLPELVAKNDPYPLHQPNQLFRNLGDGRFEEVTPPQLGDLAMSEVSRGAAIGDVDNDGDVDVLVTNNNGPVRLLANELGQGHPWIGLRLLTREGRDALGARVAISPRGGPTLWRRLHADGSYASASDPRLVIGLGRFNRVDRVLVLWPSGREEEFAGPAVGIYTTLVEGSGRPPSAAASRP